MNTSSGATSNFVLVVGNDFTAASGYAFDQAARVARRIAGSELHVVHVIEGETTAEQAKRFADELRLYIEEKGRALGGLDNQAIGIHVRCGRAARELAQFALDVGADMLLVGTAKGPHLKQLFVGSVAERLLVAAPCPVFVAGPVSAAHHDFHVPAIEPPCPDCVDARRKSAGQTWWCARHAQHHAQAHTYSYHRELPLRAHDSAVIPTGVQMK